MDIKDRILNLITPVLEENGFLLIEFILRGDDRKKIIELYVDSSDVLTAESLTELSRKINNILSLEDSLINNYRLDVSSPGVDRPLKFLQQYPKHLNRNFELTFRDEVIIKKIKAKLILVEQDKLLFSDGKKQFNINYNQIIKAKVLISFS